MKQNTAYGDAILDLLKEDKIHLLDLDDDGLRQLDAAAVAMIRQRLYGQKAAERQETAGTGREPGDIEPEDAISHSEEECLAAIELLRAIGSPEAFEALREPLPYASPRLTAATLQALAAIDGGGAAPVMMSYLDDPHPHIRMAAVDGFAQGHDENVHRQLERILDDPQVEVRAAAISVLLAGRASPASARAESIWRVMLEGGDRATQLAALSVFNRVPQPSLAEHVYRLLHHTDPDLYQAALRALCRLAEAGHIRNVDDLIVQALEKDDAESRELVLQVLAAMRTDAALEAILRLLDDDHVGVRQALVQSLQAFGKRVIEPLLKCLQSPQYSLTAKACALTALARLEGVQTDQLLPFWEGELRSLYHYKLMLTYLEAHACEHDAFLKVALRDAYERTLDLLMHLLAVWTSPDVARLVESGLHDSQQQKRAQALEALESLSERRFTRLFLPILDAEMGHANDWKYVANHQWHLDITNVPAVLEACLASQHKWLVVGAMLSTQARGITPGEAGIKSFERALATAIDDDGRHAARRALGLAAGIPVTSLPEALLSLKGMPLFSPMNLDQLYTIAAHLERYDVPAEHVIFREAEPSYDLYIIVSGEVAIIQLRRGVGHKLATLGAGQFFGDMAIFERRPRSASAVAAAPTTLLKLSAEDFRQVVLQEPAIAFVIFRVLSERLSRFEQEEAAA
jgi:HEAT repeat protein